MDLIFLGRCWKCGGNIVDDKDKLGERCLQCGRTPDWKHEEEVERKKTGVKGNPKSYGTDPKYRAHNPDLEGFTMSLLAKMCGG